MHAALVLTLALTPLRMLVLRHPSSLVLQRALAPQRPRVCLCMALLAARELILCLSPSIVPIVLVPLMYVRACSAFPDGGLPFGNGT